MNEKIRQLDSLIKESNSLGILTHISPDGDTISSALALYYAINQKYKKKCNLYLSSTMPKTYKFLPQSKQFKIVNEADGIILNDLVIAVDCATKERISYAKNILKAAKYLINIDHHKSNTNYGDLNIINSSCASNTILLLEIFKFLDIKLNCDMATCLYTGIISDTGGFRYSNTDKKVFEASGELLKYNIDINYINEKCFMSKDKKSLMLQSYIILNSVFVLDNKVVYSVVTNDILAKFNAKSEHTEGIIDEMKKIDTCDIAILFKQYDENIVKISMRSKNTDISQIAEKFGGGGHIHACGLTINSDIKTAINSLLSEVEKNICQ